MSRDLSFLEFKDTDSEDIHNMKTFWQMVMALPEDERGVFTQEEWVREEQDRLQWMVESNKSDDDMVAYLTSRAKEYVSEYEEDGNESHLEAAEFYADLAAHYKKSKYTIGDIRKQRERIQWQRRKLNQMTKPTTEPSQSSEVSKS